MAEVKWIKITTDIFNDEKILLIEQLPDADTIIVIWFKLLCMAGRDNNNGIFVMNNRVPYTEEMLAALFRRPLNTVRLALSTFEAYGMIDIIDDVITLPNWEKHQNIDGLDKIREQNRIRKRKQRERQKLALLEQNNEVSRDSHELVTQGHATEEEIEEDIDIDIKKNTNCAPGNAPCVPKVSKSDIDFFFETIWMQYPNKKGKGQVSASKKKTLYDIGMNEMTRAIDRYKYDLAKEDWRKPQNGSTFFNSGYVDYLDANYQPLEAKPRNGRKEMVPDWINKSKQNKFINCHQRSYEGDNLEKMLLESEP